MSTIAVLGMPNTGKSTLFNRLTGHHAHIGNWPGLTVDLMQAQLRIDGQTLQLVDLPGIYDLRGHSEDEAVVRRFLERTPVDLVLVVLNASQLDRQLRLALQVQRLGLPALVLLNMADEASRFGVQINTEALSAELKLPVQLLSAKYRQGIDTLQHCLVHQLDALQEPVTAVQQLEPRLAAMDAELDAAMAALVERSITLPGRWRDQRTRRLDAVLLLTEWAEFASLDWDAIASVMRQPAWLFDARATADASAARAAGLVLARALPGPWHHPDDTLGHGAA